MGIFTKHYEGFEKEGILYLRREIPEIKELEQMVYGEHCDEFEYKGFVYARPHAIILFYEAVAPNLFPSPSARLKEKHFKVGAFARSDFENHREPNAICELALQFYLANLQINLRLHNSTSTFPYKSAEQPQQQS